jgi:hypothetical protein
MSKPPRRKQRLARKRLMDQFRRASYQLFYRALERVLIAEASA